MLKLQKRGGNGASPRSSFIIKSKMVTTKIRRYKPSFHPPKICLHCRQQLQVYVRVNPIIFWPSLKKKKKKKTMLPFFPSVTQCRIELSGLQCLKKEQFWDKDTVRNFLLHHLPFFSHSFHFSSLSSFFPLLSFCCKMVKKVGIR